MVRDAGAPYTNCWGFVDGTVRPVCRPGTLQRTLYNVHKRVHAIKLHSVVTPNGRMANLFGPVEGGVMTEHVTRFWLVATVTVLLSLSLWQSFMHLWWPPFRGLHLTPLQRQFNTAMSSVRASVEWVFGDIINYFSFLDFKKNLKLGLSAVGKMYIVCALLTNARSCLYPTSTSGFFNLGTPTLQEHSS